jgi:hypothetical protein
MRRQTKQFDSGGRGGTSRQTFRKKYNSSETPFSHPFGYCRVGERRGGNCELKPEKG